MTHLYILTSISVVFDFYHLSFNDNVRESHLGKAASIISTPIERVSALYRLGIRNHAVRSARVTVSRNEHSTLHDEVTFRRDSDSAPRAPAENARRRARCHRERRNTRHSIALIHFTEQAPRSLLSTILEQTTRVSGPRCVYSCICLRLPLSLPLPLWTSSRPSSSLRTAFLYLRDQLEA